MQAKRSFAILALVALSGCVSTIKLPGTQDPTVEIVRALAASQTASIKALTDALARAQASACPVPEGGVR